MVELFSPERLRLARQRRGWLVQELAARVGVNSKTVSRWESAEKSPTAENVDTLARVLEFPRDFFFGDAPPMLETAAFRALARMTRRQRDMALAAGAEAVSLDLWITNRFRRPPPNVPDLRDSAAEDASVAVRAMWGLGYRPIPNIVHVLEKNGVRVYSLVCEGEEIDAFSDWQGETPFIFLNTIKTAERSRMDAAHELGHLVLHEHTAGGSTKAEEDDAQAFASAFLMPAAPFIASAPRRLSLGVIIEAKQRWGVSALAYVHRLYTLDRLSNWQYRSLCIEIKSNYRGNEPGPERPRESSQVLAKVLSGANAGTRKEIVKHLRIPPEHLDEITFGLSLTGMAGGARNAPAQPAPTPSTKSGGIRLVRS